MTSSAAVLHSSRHIAAVAAVAAVLSVTAATSASPVSAASASPAAAAAAVAATGQPVLYLHRHVRPHYVSLSFLHRGSHRCSRDLFESYHRSKGLQQDLGYHRISSRILIESSKRGSPYLVARSINSKLCILAKQLTAARNRGKSPQIT